MKAVLFHGNKQKPELIEVETPKPKDGEILIKLDYAALNHRDLWIWKEQMPATPVIPGSDGSGTVVAVGKDADTCMIGKQVIINPSLYWGDDDNVQSKEYQILGHPANGTFAEYITINHAYVYEKPTHLTTREAAALPLSALTAYRALFTKAQLKISDKVLITGIGGGAALFLLQMAVASGCEVYVTSSSLEKIEKAKVLGAKGGFVYKETDWVEKARREVPGFDVIIDSAGGDGFADLTEIANPAARIVVFGRTAGNINNLKPGVLFNKQLSIIGTLMGTSKEFEAMLAFYENKKLHPAIDKEFALAEIQQAFEYMEKAKQFGKIVLKITS